MFLLAEETKSLGLFFCFKLVKTLSEVVGFVGMALWHSLFVLDPLDGIMFYCMSFDFCSINVDISQLYQVVTLVLCWVNVRHTGPRCLVATFRKKTQV